MIGVDTNILLRLATNDDPAQVASIRRWLAIHAQGELLYVNHVVLAEAIWALKSVYRADRWKVAHFVDTLLGNAGFEVEDAAAVEDALQSYQSGNVDFPDCLIAAKNAGRCDLTITFDKGAASLSQFSLAEIGAGTNAIRVPSPPSLRPPGRQRAAAQESPPLSATAR